jgi:glycosyltransferase involved in cell wall biosynthesis
MTRIRNGEQAYSGLSGRSILCIGTADWSRSLWTNQQHLMSRLARHNTVLFSESQGLRRPTVSGRDLSRIARRLRAGMRGPRLLDGVWVVSPLVVPVHSSAAIRALNRRILVHLLLRAARVAGLEHPILWAYNPHAHELCGSFGESLVIYHCVDDIAAQEHIDEASFSAAERAMAARADLVFVSSRPLIEHMRRQGAARVAYLPNVADVTRFDGAEELPEPALLASLSRPRLVFAGAVAAKKLDVELLTNLATSRPAWSIVLVGPVGEGDPRGDLGRLLELPNVHAVGPVSFEELPGWIGHADACLIPYAMNRYTASVFPMKVYEYLAAGRPVVSTPLPSLEGVEPIERASDWRGFAAAVERVLDGPDERELRTAAARAHSWESRLAEIAQLVTEREAGAA